MSRDRYINRNAVAFAIADILGMFLLAIAFAVAWVVLT